MSLDAELLLLGVGLLEPPSRSHVRAIRGLEEEIKAAVREAIDRENPGPLLDVPERVTYHARLFKYQADYAALNEVIGPELATDYQLLHQRAQAIMLARRPVTEIQTLLGPRQVENSFDQDAQYAREAETVENHLRLPKDLAAGGVMPACVALFAGLFPEVYAMEVIEAWKAMRENLARDPEWLPPQWLDGAIRILFRIPFDITVDLSGPEPPQVGAAPPEATPKGKLKLRPERLQSPGQSIIATPEPNR